MTEAGPTNQRAEANAERPSADLIDAINQVFALFRINYHNQYHKAFDKVEVLNMAKRLWVETLKPFNSLVILQAAKKIITESEYLPSINRMIKACQESAGTGQLPDPHSAYVEACRAPSPKTDHHWSHPAVYYAGKEADWYFLANNTEQKAFPIFAQCYQRVCARVLAGEDLPLPKANALPERMDTTLSKNENQERLAALRSSLKL